MPRPSSVNFDSALSSRRSTARSPCAEGRVETRTSTARPPMRSEIRPSCGRRRSAMSSSAMIFRREISAACSARFGCTTSRSDAVDAKAHRARALVGLDVDVAGAVLRGLREQRVEHADDRRVVRGLEQVLDRRQLLHHPRQVDRALDLADHHRGARLAAGIGGGDAAGQGLGRLALEAVDVVEAQHFRERRQGDRLRRPEHQAGAVVLEQQGVRLGVGVGQRMAGAHAASQPPGADAGGSAGLGAGFGACGGGEDGGVSPAAPCPANSAARRSARRCPRGAAAAARSAPRSPAPECWAAAAGPAGTSGSGRSGRPRACSRSRRRAAPSAAGRPSGWSASCPGSRCGTTCRGTECRRGTAPSTCCR